MIIFFSKNRFNTRFLCISLVSTSDTHLPEIQSAVMILCSVLIYNTDDVEHVIKLKTAVYKRKNERILRLVVIFIVKEVNVFVGTQWFFFGWFNPIQNVKLISRRERRFRRYFYCTSEGLRVSTDCSRRIWEFIG